MGVAAWTERARAIELAASLRKVPRYDATTAALIRAALRYVPATDHLWTRHPPSQDVRSATNSDIVVALQRAGHAEAADVGRTGDLRGVRGNPRGEARVLRRESQERPAVVLSLSSDGRYIVDENGTRYGLDGKPLYDGSFHVEKPANRPPKRNPRDASWLRWFATLDASGAIEALDPYGNRDPEDVLREARRILAGAKRAGAPRRNLAKKAAASGWPVQVVEVRDGYDYDALPGPFMETDHAGIVLIDGRAVSVPRVTWVRYRAPGSKYVGNRQVYAEDSMPWRGGTPPRVGDTINVTRYPKFPR